MKKTVAIHLLSASLLTTACTWVELGSQGAQVKTVQKEDILQCKKVGNIEVKGKHQVLGISRNKEKLMGELEILARNEASQIGANTIVAENTPDNGQQHFSAYQCQY